MSLYLGEKLVSGIGQDRIADTLPIGAIIEWDSDLIPENWLLLNGQAVSRTVYSELFAIYGTTYGAGDGSTTFNLPDRRTRVAVGRDANDEDFAALGITGGEKEHTLSIDELAKHKHLIYQDAHGNGVKFAVVTSYGATGGSAIQAAAAGGVSNLSPNSGDNAVGLVNAEYSGGSHPHNNLQPYIVTNFIVKAKLYTTEFIGGNIVIDNLTSDSSVNVLSARMGKELDAKKFDRGEVIDYVVEEGTEGIWTYRKWNSGVAECFGKTTVNILAGAFTAWGNSYIASIGTVDYPITFTKLPEEIMSISTSSGSGWGNFYLNTQTTTGKCDITRPTNLTSEVSVFLKYYVIGEWK